MRLGQFEFQSNPDTDARNYTVSDSSSNTESYTNTGAVERHDYRESTRSQRRACCRHGDCFT